MFMNFVNFEKNNSKVVAEKAFLGERTDATKGYIFEIACKRNNKVAGKGEFDHYITVKLNNGEKVKRSVEIKTNGGRIDNVLKANYVVYAMDICNSTTKGKHRETYPVIMKSETFMDILERCGAIKKVNKGGLLDGHAIQVSNKAFYETMLNYPVKYKRNKVWTESDIL